MSLPIKSVYKHQEIGYFFCFIFCHILSTQTSPLNIIESQITLCWMSCYIHKFYLNFISCSTTTEPEHSGVCAPLESPCSASTEPEHSGACAPLESMFCTTEPEHSGACAPLESMFCNYWAWALWSLCTTRVHVLQLLSLSTITGESICHKERSHMAKLRRDTAK